MTLPRDGAAPRLLAVCGGTLLATVSHQEATVHRSMPTLAQTASVAFVLLTTACGGLDAFDNVSMNLWYGTGSVVAFVRTDPDLCRTFPDNVIANINGEPLDISSYVNRGFSSCEDGALTGTLLSPADNSALLEVSGSLRSMRVDVPTFFAERSFALRDATGTARPGDVVILDYYGPEGETLTASDVPTSDWILYRPDPSNPWTPQELRNLTAEVGPTEVALALPSDVTPGWAAIGHSFNCCLSPQWPPPADWQSFGANGGLTRYAGVAVRVPVASCEGAASSCTATVTVDSYFEMTILP